MARILFVEDDTLVRHGLSRVLESGGHELRACGTVREAMELSDSFDAELALLDVGLPDGDGVQCARALRGKGFSGPIVFLTARGDAQQVSEAAAAAPQAYLVKPISGAQLLPAIQAALATARTAVEERAELLAALRESREISAAVGALMERHGWDMQHAFGELRARARASRRRITEVAVEVLIEKPAPALGKSPTPGIG